MTQTTDKSLFLVGVAFVLGFLFVDSRWAVGLAMGYVLGVDTEVLQRPCRRLLAWARDVVRAIRRGDW